MKYMREILNKETLGFIIYIGDNNLSVKQINFQTNKN